MSASPIQIATIVSNPFQQNTFVASLTGMNTCVVVDPGLQPAKIITHLEREGLVPAAFLITHGHADHIGGNHALKQRWPDCPIVIGRNDAIKLTDAEENLSAGFGMPVTSPPADILLDDGETYSAAGFDLLVREIPGHSSGHIVFIWQAGRPMIVFGGDVLFSGSIGRTDFPGGSFDELAAGIREKLYTLPDNTIVLPGHGPATTIGEEQRNNAFVPGKAG